MLATTAPRRRGRARAGLVLAAVATLVLGACGGSAEQATDTVTTATTPAPTPTPTPTTAAPTTAVARPTTIAPSTSTSTTAALPTTSTLPRQTTTPIAPPADVRAAEPVIEMGRIAIPKIGVDATMYEGIRLSTLDFGPGHWPGSATPGQIGNVVVAGHRTSKHQVFRNLDQLVAGDEITFTDDEGVHVYTVTAVEIVGPEAMWIVDPTDTPIVTLFACHPPGSTAQRIVVSADLQV